MKFLDKGYAQCRDVDPELFFPIGYTSRLDLEQIKETKEVCADCLIRIGCLRYALENPGLSGVWRGTTPNERDAIRQRRSSKRKPAAAQESEPLTDSDTSPLSDMVQLFTALQPGQ
jgi:WhiB family redox-sensing transcriptional regulator